jgi:hypothetical protein
VIFLDHTFEYKRRLRTAQSWRMPACSSASGFASRRTTSAAVVGVHHPHYDQAA